MLSNICVFPHHFLSHIFSLYFFSRWNCIKMAQKGMQGHAVYAFKNMSSICQLTSSLKQ